MNKQARNLIGMVVILVALIGSFFLVKFWNQKQEEKKEAEDTADQVTISDISDTIITGFSYKMDGDTISFVKENDTWYSEDDRTLNLDQDKVNALAEKLTSITAKRELNGKEVSTDEFGFETPTNVITLKTTEGISIFTFGMKNTMTDEYYMIINNSSDNVYVLDTTIPTDMNQQAEDLIAEEKVSEDSISQNEVINSEVSQNTE